MTKTLLSFLLALTVPFTSAAQEPSSASAPSSEAERTQRAAQIGDYLAVYHALEKFSGSALVTDGGEIVYEGAFGLANEDWQIPNFVGTKFRLASISKQFTAMLVLLLVEDGQLELDAPIVRYLPDYSAESGKQVTVHHLLNHTSGIPNYTNRPGFMKIDALHHHSTDEFVAEFCSDPLEFEPGAHFHYSNSGYYLLAAIIEKVTGHSYGEALREKILAPLEMDDTGHDDSNAVLANRATGYYELLGQRRIARRVDTTSFVGAGSLYSTVGDLWKWDRALRSKQLLQGELEQRMFTQGKGDYGYGWFVDGANSDAPVFWHAGVVSGFSTMILRSPEQDRCIILLSNSSTSSVNDAVVGIAEILDGNTPNAPFVDVDRALARRVLDDGIKTGLVEFARLSPAVREQRIERNFNALGYQLLGQGRTSEAMLLLEFNTQAFPEIANTWDSLGEAYLTVGKREKALESYRKAFELDPSSPTAVAMLNKLSSPGSPELTTAPPDPLKDWPSETFELPSNFAPDLPKGIESLRFAPGWRNPISEEFWSYVFAMWIEEPAPDAARVAELLDLYYDGLLLGFAGSAGKDIGIDPVQVEATLISPGYFEARMHVIDAFATFEPMDLRVRVSAVTDANNRTVMRVQVSPQPEEHEIWRSLEVAVLGIQEP